MTLAEIARETGRTAARYYLDRGRGSPELIGRPVSLTQHLKGSQDVTEEEVALVAREWQRGVAEEWDARRAATWLK